MTFLNWGMLIGLLAVAVPVLIHLLNRRRARVMDWGAMRFLREAMAAQERRLRLEELLLLALRCALVGTLVLAMARPFLPSRAALPWVAVVAGVVGACLCLAIAFAGGMPRRARQAVLVVGVCLLVLGVLTSIVEHVAQRRLWARGEEGRDIAILIDASSSMGLASGDATLFEQAVAEARAAVLAARPADALTVLLAGQVPQPLLPAPTTDHRRVLEALDGLNRPQGGSMQILPALGAAVEQLATGPNPHKRIVVISDAQRVGWDATAEGRWRSLGGEMSRLPTPPRLVRRTLPTPARVENLALEELSLSRPIVGTDRPVRIAATVRNTGHVPLVPGRVHLLVDGQAVGSSDLPQIAPGSAEAVTFVWHFNRPGRHVLQARLDGADDLPADNALWRVVDVVQSLDVLIVDGDDGDGTGRSAGSYVAAAFGWDAQPVPDGAGDADGLLLRPRIVAAPDVAGIDDLQPYAMVLLVNVPRLPEAFARELEAFVRRGGGLLVAPGAWAEPDFYNNWSDSYGRGLMPGRLVERVAPLDSPARCVVETFSHPAMALLATPSRGGETLVHAWWRIAPVQEGQVRIGGMLDTGDPLLLEQRVGAGAVAMLSLGLGAEDSSLPAQGAYVYLVHELAQHLASPRGGDANVRAGERATVRLSDPRARQRGSGLQGEYFAKPDFTERRHTRIDPRIDFDWGHGSPVSGVGPEDFSVRWTGQIRADFSETWTFHGLADDEMVVWIDGREILHNRGRVGREASGQIHLEAGRWYDLRVDFREGRHQAMCRLMWSSPSRPRQVVPAGSLYPPPGVEGAPPPPSPAADLLLELARPGGGSTPITARLADGALTLSFATAAPGVYRAILPADLHETFAAQLASDGALPVGAWGDAQESALLALGAGELAAIRRYLEAEGVELLDAASAEEMLAAISGQTPGQEIWRWMVLAVLGGLVGEIALARWFAGRRGAHNARTVHFGQEGREVAFGRTRQLLGDAPQMAVGGRAGR